MDGNGDKAKGSGVWVHPVAQTNMRVEKFESLWQKHTIPSALKPSMTRLQANVLPLLAIPFVPFDVLKSGVIPAEAQARAERVLLKYYWNLANLLRIAPETDAEKLVRQLLDKITRCPGISRRDLQRACPHSRPKDFEDATAVLVNRSLVTFKESDHKNKQQSVNYWANERKPDVLPPLMERFSAPTIPAKFTDAEPTIDADQMLEI